jgi:2'-5' RNA ligase
MKITLPPLTLLKALGESRGCIVAIPVLSKVAKRIKLKGPKAEKEKDMHITVVYLESGQDINFIVELMKKFSEKMERGIKLEIQGVGRFQKDDEDVIYASVNSFALEKLRTAILKELDTFDIKYDKTFGFIPHITLEYVKKTKPTPKLPEDALMTWEVDSIEIWHDEEHISL